jgi:polyketide cyclase/dehydrase/lipid transport protein
MGPLFASIVIDAPRERIFELIADLSARPAFCDHFLREYRLERMEASGVGAAARFRLDAPRNNHWEESRIVELDRPRLVKEQGRGGHLNRVPTHWVWEILQDQGSSARVDVAYWTEPQRLFDRLRDFGSSRRWYRRQLSRALERLRDAAESEVSEVSRVAVGGG